MDTTLNLGPGAVAGNGGNPFTVPAAQWHAIGGFLDGINNADAGASSAIIAALPDYAKLRECAAAWRARTYPNLLSLSRQIASYGNYFAQQLSPQLNTLLTQPAPQRGAAVDALLQPAIESARRCAELSAALVPDLQALSAASAAVQRALPGAISALTAQSVGIPGIGDNAGLAARLAAQVGAIGANLAQVAVLYAVTGNVPLADIERLRGAWGGIADDLGLLRQAMQSPITGEDPVLAGLDLQVASSQWQTVAGEATAFSSAA